MQVSVETISKIGRKMTIVVPSEKVDQEFDKRILKIAQTASLKGFRPGKVPLDYVKQRFSDVAREEALSEVIKSSLYGALAQEKLNPIGVPTVEPKTMLAGQPLEFVATFEVLPEVTQVNFKLDKIDKEITTVSAAEVDKVIDKIREQHTKWNVVDRAAQDHDQVLIDFTGMLNGQPFPGGAAKDYPLVLGNKSMIPGFEEGILGAKVGEERTIKVTFPEQYHAKDIAGKDAEFIIKVKQVYQPELPTLDDEFIKRLGVKSGNLEEFKNEIRKNLDREVVRLTKTKLKSELFKLLLEQNPLEIPKALIEREAQRIHDQVHPHHGKEHHHTQAEMAAFEKMGEQNVMLSLLVTVLVKQHNLVADPAKVNQLLADLAGAYEKPEEMIAHFRKDKQRYAQFEAEVVEDLLVEKLLQDVAVNEKMMGYEEFVNSSEQG
jgi:trigger factor